MVVGSGPALVLVPGIQGRWEWMRPAVRELAKRFRVITFSLSGHLGRPAVRGGRCSAFDRQVVQVEDAMARAAVDRAIICGVSYGGLVALRFAATRPARTAALVLASTPGPSWQPDERSRRYVRRPLRSLPAFVLGARSRLWHEVAAARADRLGRWQTIGRYVWEVVSHPPAPWMMARRVLALESCDFTADARAVAAPTLVLTGDPGLDRVVPVAGTREYAALIRGASSFVLEGTGHLGLITKAEEFAGAIAAFATSLPRRSSR